jgi:hypothetical protein
MDSFRSFGEQLNQAVPEEHIGLALAGANAMFRNVGALFERITEHRSTAATLGSVGSSEPGSGVRLSAKLATPASRAAS